MVTCHALKANWQQGLGGYYGDADKIPYNSKTGQFGSNPSTPTKPRIATQPHQSPSMAGGFEGSPASTFSSSARTGTPSNHADASQTPFRGLFAGARSTAPAEAQRQLYVRADPTLLTCFDPTDKELYDLWAPKR
ncbi:hypothetical protein NP233_g11339 [Leucocoprinus birnbaumii]|uniref:Uncharacterized protein n=1 Tax=Leucocoprinus birnbaumii TaxID=56174 RepID=A0AAD5VGL4_9AGAR|nr:hypothetical protein NP233_g11339 [Leucocoprinus birnbaumii]